MINSAWMLAPLMVLASNSMAMTSYNLISLGTMGGFSSYAMGINDSGQVVGYSYLDEHGNQIRGFISNPGGGQLNDIGSLGGTTTLATDINNLGQITGLSYGQTGPYHSFISDPNGGSLHDMGTLSSSPNDYSWGSAINDLGQVVGLSDLNSSGGYAFISEPNGGSLSNLGSLENYNAGFQLTQATDINNLGQVVGLATTYTGGDFYPFPLHAFISGPNGVVLHDLGTLGGRDSYATGINDSGQVVGYSSTVNNTSHAFISDPNGGALHDLGTLGGESSNATAINNLGQVIGSYNLGPSVSAIRNGVTYDLNQRFFVTQEDVMLDLNTLVAAVNLGWTFLGLSDINNKGQISGWGINPLGTVEAFMLNPEVSSVPEPETILLVGLMVPSLVRMRKR